ncbi:MULTISPECIES: glycosyltransferase family 4 protein [unclassified Cobetia]|uniref:glycosyltransferase family 4 protein n=1 Tax=unclassified Cobetia TaxID=2609414 RepID=UPI0020979EBA|nr:MULTISPECIES: glycosyltransferase family 4 protein [unclassified Cobetia]MCO7233422.1 glycosyltransferase family 4 protein [Cobetia sp. Dlab-2-AX]MCO7236696.1 glycosyltransferase family 4 protein [Cobetia sp. Dlab-2-U]
MNNIRIWAPKLMNSEGDRLVGGIQTYIWDLSNGLADNNYEVEVYFPAEENLEFMHNKSKFYGVKVKDWKAGKSVTSNIALNIIGTSTLIPNNIIGPCVGIQHGILWDRPVQYNRLWNIFPLLRNSIRVNKYSKLVNRFDHLVCVDLAYPQFVASTNPPLNWNTLTYIPNYAHIDDQVVPSLGGGLNKVIFPRRFVEHRGVRIAIHLAEKFASDSLEFHFIGEGPEEKLINNLANNNKNIKVYKLPYENRLEAYDANTITLIPSLSTEGTSLVCLEAWSRGSIVLSSPVGGLSNLILNNVNGKLSKPTEEEFEINLNKLLTKSTNELDLIRKNAYYGLTQGFSYNNWIYQWVELCNNIIQKECHKRNV